MDKWEYLCCGFTSNSWSLHTNYTIEYFSALPDSMEIRIIGKGKLGITWKDNKHHSPEEFANTIYDFLGSLGWEAYRGDSYYYYFKRKI